ncbi:hypothetical protein LOTGIDRAFT_162544 [Lottia gigantea]|uniref:Chitin-binding type-2 domain-containing protein n=1 Tax=Lottia gigantea TaxID=225164 RepID=V4AGU2_LOTGI|nr:hypothetical protein LOTGIDRAFT_162544 [Lottia gigantea]ESO92626.1 hypothetical protein LOTGIDRAFT_162544 [Lottia gigantea]
MHLGSIYLMVVLLIYFAYTDDRKERENVDVINPEENLVQDDEQYVGDSTENIEKSGSEEEEEDKEAIEEEEDEEEELNYRYIPEPAQDIVDNGKKYIQVHCSFKQDESLIRHPSNCSRYFVCSYGVVEEMPVCDDGEVFSIQVSECVKKGSENDDCDKLPFDSPPEITRGTQPSLIWHPRHKSPRSQFRQPTTLQMKVPHIELESFTCSATGKVLSHHSENCAWYYNCSAHPDAVMQTFYSGFIMECPYPQLFSTETKQCEDFEDVKCGDRYEPKSPCDYRANHCHETSHCIPCWVRYASCLELPDGLNPWSELEWKPFFVECYKERTVFQGVCDKSAVFSPLTRACETPYSIPRQHGGWRPVCDGRRDGIYADEYGRCDIYYVCKGYIFTGFFRCEKGEMFNPVISICQKPEAVPYPCGDLEMPNICESSLNGYHLDMFGRCTHYFECKDQQLEGISMCPSGIFNPELQICESSRDQPKPCGNLTNLCTHKNDGFHSDENDCTKVFQCERGLTMTSYDCSGSVRTECDVCNTPTECNDKPNGLYPNLKEGVGYYYDCVRSQIQNHYKCDKEKGGPIFNPVKQRCFYPEDLCKEVFSLKIAW